MIGLMQIMIYLFCIYLVYKGVEIFQTAFVAAPSMSRNIGMIIGAIATVSAVAVAICALIMEETLVKTIADKQAAIPPFPGLK